MATPTDQDREKARTLVRGYLGKSQEVNVVVEEHVAQALADEREQMEENCGCEGFERAVRADEREAAYRAGQQRGWFDARKRSWQLVAAEREKVEIQMRNAIRQGQDIGEYGRIIGWLLAAEHVIENYAVRPEPPPSEGAKL